MEPFPRRIRPLGPPLGIYLRPGQNDHSLLTQLSVEGKQASGVVFDARYGERHEGLRSEVSRRKLEAVLDPRSVELAAPGAFSPSMKKLPWAANGLHRPEDLAGPSGSAMVKSLAEFAVRHSYSAVLAPTHYLSSENGRETAGIDARLARGLRDELDRLGASATLIYYPFVVQGSALQDEATRQHLTSEIRGLDIDAIWLRVHPFGTTRSGPAALTGYIESARSLHELGLPIVADRTGTVGLALMAFGAVGGIETGITQGETFDMTRLQRAPRPGSQPFAPQPRVYLPELGAFLTRNQAEEFFRHRMMKSWFSCRDSECCRRGVEDTIRLPGRHFVVQRLREVNRLGQVPADMRASFYLDQFLRPASDRILRAIQVEPRLEAARRRLEDWRITLSAILEIDAGSPSISAVPEGKRMRQLRGA